MATIDQRNNLSDERAIDGARRAAAWVRREKLERAFGLTRDRFIARGEPAGRVRIESPTAPERRLLGDLLGRPKPLGPLAFSLEELDRALRGSAFASSLVDLLEALDETPIVTRPALRDARQRDEIAWRHELETVLRDALSQAPSPDLIEAWGCAHGLSWLYRRFKPAGPADRARAGEAFARCLGALARLPRASPARLAVFATEMTGDPHAFDPDHLAGQLLTAALVRLSAGPGEDASGRVDSDPRPTAENRAAAFGRFGLLTDTVWATVAAFNLARALTRDGSPDPLVDAAGGRVLSLSLRQLGHWRAVVPARADVYLVENPSVFETLVDELEARGVRCPDSPTLVCTAGYPSQPGYRLLDLLVAGGAARFWYSGDFDPEGLEIAAAVLGRYPDHARTWRFGVGDYARAAVQGVPAREGRTRELDRLSTVFPDLVPAMRARRVWGYQEALIDLLLADVALATSENQGGLGS